MTYEAVRELSITIASICAAVIAVGGAGALMLRLAQWATTQVERARKVTALVADVPLLAAQLVKVSAILDNLARKFDDHERKHVASETHLAESKNGYSADSFGQVDKAHNAARL
jgi:hypothetical protein